MVASSFVNFLFHTLCYNGGVKRYVWIFVIILLLVAIAEVVIAILLGLHFFAPSVFNLPVKGSPTVTQAVTSMPTVSQPSSANAFPAQILDLTNWKLTLPVGKAESPTEIKQLALAHYLLEPWFVVTADKKGVRFRAPVTGVTTSGSGYPRSELREMVNNGTKKASWSSTSGTHTLFLDQAITQVPKKKQHIVTGQIHDADDDVIVIRLDYPTLYVNVDGENVVVLDNTYQLGKRFTVQFVVEKGKTDVFYNNSTTISYTLNKNYSGAYFKAGAYTQSNCEREDASHCNENNYGEVVLYQVKVLHK